MIGIIRNMNRVRMLELLAVTASCTVVVVSYVPTSLPAVQLLIMQCFSDPVRLLL